MLAFECTLAADSSPLSPPPTLITFLFLLPPCARLHTLPHASAGRSYSSARSGGPCATTSIGGGRVVPRRDSCVLGVWCTTADGVRARAGGWGICVRTSSACCALWATYAAGGRLPASRWGAWRHLRS
ncbi:hypothetical protein C8J57DRAFT_1326036 [Mycena rebaudengoi]|nr:hypothetical protein C8J57DRAFT_1326036 [Mycena rebaudengoi]